MARRRRTGRVPLAMSDERIAAIRWHVLRISPKTRWSFVELADGAGRVGVGEATLLGREGDMERALDALRPALIDRAPGGLDLADARAHARDRAQFAVVSALDQARWDLRARQAGHGVAELLGARARERIPLYANINRGIAVRTPEGFAEQARRARADGFTAFKIAPFDGVELYGKEDARIDAPLLDAGLARIAAVRDAIGPDADLMVDCHWRLNRATAETVIRATAAQRLYWLECPVPETPQTVDTLRHLRTAANAQGVRLAGCEEMSLVQGFAPFFGCYDVMMPDVKYVGGLAQMLEVATALHAQGIDFSPHNPTGPVCHAASLHVCAVAPHFARLEMQYAETPTFDALVSGALPSPRGGAADVPPGPGFGVALDQRLVRTLAEPPAA